MTKAFIVTILFVSAAIKTSAQKPVTAGHLFRDCKECPAMVVIPAGTFTIGSDTSEDGYSEVEGPQKQITIAAFAAAQFDVTKKEWETFVAATNRPVAGGCAFSGFKDTAIKAWQPNPKASWKNPGFAQDGTHPVICITWFDAQDYVKWLTAKTGKAYRLLTEAEWEYAARAGTTTAYPWGATASHDHANYGADSGWVGLAAGKDKWMATSPVGSFSPNRFGLYDMHGNVLQYVEDYFSPSYADISDTGAADTTGVILTMPGSPKYMTGTKSSDYRMVRGGDWGDPPWMIRSGFRNWAPGRGFTIQNYRSAGVGFRVARALNDTDKF